MPVLWLYTREGVFDSEDAHRKSRLPLTVCWSDAKAGDFLKRHEQNCSEKQLGKRNFFREPSTYSQHLKHSEKKVRPWKTLHHCSCATAGQAPCEDTRLPPLCAGVWWARATFAMNRLDHHKEFILHGFFLEVRDATGH